MKDERRRIDGLDREITRLLQERSEAAQKIGAHKARQEQGAFDPAREAEVLRAVGETEGPLSARELRAIFTEIISACRALEEPLRVAYMGPEHTFSHVAARQKFGSQAHFEPLPTVTEVFRQVEAEQAQVGVVPVENSTGGVVAETLDCLLASELKICAELHLAIHLAVMAPGELAQVRTMYTHPQPLSQTRQWLRENLPGVEVTIASSTSAAAQQAAADPCGAALAPLPAAEAYGLRVLATNVEDEPSNRTRFFLIALADARPTGRDKTSLVFSTAHRPGALHEAMGAFADHGLNLTLIQSRPTHGQLWQYVFFVDFEGHHQDANVQAMLGELREHCALLKILGSYPAEEG
jgi:chorismate mutase/prephenate dehydratase